MPVNVVDRLTRLGSVIGRPSRLGRLSRGRHHPHRASCHRSRHQRAQHSPTFRCSCCYHLVPPRKRPEGIPQTTQTFTRRCRPRNPRRNPTPPPRDLVPRLPHTMVVTVTGQRRILTSFPTPPRHQPTHWADNEHTTPEGPQTAHHLAVAALSGDVSVLRRSCFSRRVEHMTYLPGFCHGRRALAQTIGQHAYDVWVIRHLIDHCPSPRPHTVNS